MDTKKLRQKILDLAIRGRLVTQDPNDEPASVLLERIRAEKERLIKEGKIKRSKKSASDTPHYENVPFEVPEGWEWCTIDDIAESNIGLTYKPSDISNEGVPVYRSNNIQNRSICLDDVVRVDTQILENQYLHESDLLICARNGSRNLVGKCALIPKLSEPTTFGAFMAVCRSSYNKWIFLLLNSDYFDAYLDDSNSTAINQVTQKMLLAFQMPFPPVNEQDRIYNEVCKWFSVIDILEFEERDLKLSIEKAKSKILDLAIHGKLVPQDPNDEPAIELLKRINPKFTPCDNAHYENVPFEIPKSWRWTCMAEVNEYNSASVDPSKSPNNDFELYSVPAYETGMPEFVKGKDISSSKKSVSKNDVLLCKINPHLNRAWIVSHYKENKPCLASSEWIIFRNSSIIPQYLSFCFTSKYFKELMLSNVSGVGGSLMRAQPAIVNKYLFPLPPINEQCRIVAAIQEYYEILDNMSANL